MYDRLIVAVIATASPAEESIVNKKKLNELDNVYHVRLRFLKH